MAWAKHRKLQHDQDFKALRNYRKSLPADLDIINGADHSAFLLGRLQKEGNYMNKKSGRERNLMSVDRLLSRIAKYANEPEKRLKEAHQMTKATFLMVQGMPSSNKCTPELVVCVLMDCEGNAIACDHSEYGKEQNIGLHDVVSPAAMARVTTTETYVMDGVPTMVKADYTYCPFCSYACSNHRAINNHVRMHFRAILMCGWPGCYFVHMQSKKMIEHSAEVHNMAQAQPAQERGGDWWSEIRDRFQCWELRNKYTTSRRFQTDSMLNRNSGYLFLPLNRAWILQYYILGYIFSLVFVAF